MEEGPVKLISTVAICMLRPTDSELLMRFTRHRDEGAFRMLVERHGRLVQTVCRRVLQNHHDAEEAFQATFLVLARNARSIRCRDSVASWLFQVARRTAVRAAVDTRRRKEHPLPDNRELSPDTFSHLERRETFELLSVEVERLPERYRAPIVLFYLEGKSRRAAAEELDCTDAALKARLARGRRLLRQRLIRRGVSLSLVVAALDLVPGTAAAGTVSAPLIERTVSGALHYSLTGQAGASCAPGPVTLAQGVQPMTSLTLSKSTLAVGGLTAAGLIVAAVIGVQRLSAQSDGDGPRAGEASVQTVLENPASEPASPADTTLVLARSDGDDEESPSEGASHQTEENSKRDPAGTPPQDEIPTDLKRRRPPEEKIEAALEETTNLEFFDTPLTEVIGYIEDVHKIEILFDQSALQEFGISTDTPVTVELSDVTLESALDIILQDIVGGLTYVIEDEVMKITTVEAARKQIETRVYPVQDLVQAGFELEGLKSTIEKLGYDKEAVIEPLEPGLLVIQQSQPAHRQTVELLEQFRRAAAMQSK